MKRNCLVVWFSVVFGIVHISNALQALPPRESPAGPASQTT